MICENCLPPFNTYDTNLGPYLRTKELVSNLFFGNLFRFFELFGSSYYLSNRKKKKSEFFSLTFFTSVVVVEQKSKMKMKKGKIERGDSFSFFVSGIRSDRIRFRKKAKMRPVFSFPRIKIINGIF